VGPLILLTAGVLALGAGWLVVRSIGAGVRAGRLLASMRRSPVSAALAAVERGEAPYLRLEGRIDSEAEFEDADHRPLVFRRTRLQARQHGRWVDLDDRREAVRFVVREGLDEIGIDTAALDDGLIVMPRESVGTAADVPDRVPRDLPPATRVRLRIEQVSSVEHAIVLGTPRHASDGRVELTAGGGRPLVLTTLQPEEAMRVIAAGRSRPALAGALFAIGIGLLGLGAGWAALEAVL
jgi:hypothetical protein